MKTITKDEWLAKEVRSISASQEGKTMVITFEDGEHMHRRGLTHADVVKIHKEGRAAAPDMIAKYWQAQPAAERVPLTAGDELCGLAVAKEGLGIPLSDDEERAYNGGDMEEQ